MFYDISVDSVAMMFNACSCEVRSYSRLIGARLERTAGGEVGDSGRHTVSLPASSKHLGRKQVHSLCVDSRPGDRLWLIFR